MSSCLKLKGIKKVRNSNGVQTWFNKSITLHHSRDRQHWKYFKIRLHLDYPSNVTEMISKNCYSKRKHIIKQWSTIKKLVLSSRHVCLSKSVSMETIFHLIAIQTSISWKIITESLNATLSKNYRRQGNGWKIEV